MHRSTCRSLVLAAAAAAATAAATATGPRDQFLDEAQLGSLPASALGLPAGLPPRYQMNESTIIMPCNNSGYTDPQRTVGWSIIDFDCEGWGGDRIATVQPPTPVFHTHTHTHTTGCGALARGLSLARPTRQRGQTPLVQTPGARAVLAMRCFAGSNGKAIWTKQRPMLDEVVLQNQVKMSTSSSLGQTVWVYRGSMWGG